MPNDLGRTDAAMGYGLFNEVIMKDVFGYLACGLIGVFVGISTTVLFLYLLNWWLRR